MTNLDETSFKKIVGNLNMLIKFYKSWILNDKKRKRNLKTKRKIGGKTKEQKKTHVPKDRTKNTSWHPSVL